LKEAFIIYDSDGDGKVTREQATCVIRSIALSPTNEELNSMLGDSKFFPTFLHATLHFHVIKHGIFSKMKLGKV
jgi:Ca2+-binding EF-hand superfamily protein